MEFDKEFFNNFSFAYNPTTKERYSSKLDIIKSKVDPASLLLVLHNNIWESHDWTQNPQQTFDDLLILRCKQLRDKYKYLTLYFSGGADSETMVQSFIKSGVHPDEIVTNVFKIADINPLKDIDLAIEKLRKYSAYLPKTKITVNYLDRDVAINFLSRKDWFDGNFNGSVGNFRRLTLPILEELGFYKTPQPKTGHIFAELKPKLYIKSDGFYTEVQQGLSLSQYSDWFFTTPDLPELHIKQCHLAKEHFKKKFLNREITETVVINERNQYKDDLIKSCRYAFDGRWQPSKFGGLGLDLNNKLDTEDSVVYRLMKSKDYPLFDIYSSKIKEMLSGAYKIYLDKNRIDVKMPFKTQQYWLGT